MLRINIRRRIMAFKVAGRSTQVNEEASCSNVRGFFVDLNCQVSPNTHQTSKKLSVSTQPFADNAKVIQK